MPEGHSVHRIARQFQRNFVGEVCAASSPQGRFAVGAAEIDGLRMLEALAVGKQLFLRFERDLWLRVHLGIYGAWDFAGEIASADDLRVGPDHVADEDAEDSVSSIGAPRRSRLRIAEGESVLESAAAFPPEPVGAVRVRLLTERSLADLRGPTVCEVAGPAEVQAVLDRLGPDPQHDDSPAAEEKFWGRLHASSRPIGVVLMDQSVVSGIGNVYRAELLFRAGINPHTPAREVTREQARALWLDWGYLLDIGVRVGQMLTMDGLSDEEYRNALARRADRHWVYKREGLPCRRCGVTIVLEEMAKRKLYWCVACQL